MGTLHHLIQMPWGGTRNPCLYRNKQLSWIAGITIGRALQAENMMLPIKSSQKTNVARNCIPTEPKNAEFRENCVPRNHEAKNCRIRNKMYAQSAQPGPCSIGASGFHFPEFPQNWRVLAVVWRDSVASTAVAAGLLLPALPLNCCALAVDWRDFAAWAVERLARFVYPGCGSGIAAVASALRLLALVHFWHLLLRAGLACASGRAFPAGPPSPQSA